MNWLNLIFACGACFWFGRLSAIPEGEMNAYRRGYEAGRRRADNESGTEQS